MASHSKKSLEGICCLLMASLFALSTFFQGNDPDWYFWIPLYASASTANLIKWWKPKKSSRIRKLAKFGLWLGLFLLMKVGAEELVNDGVSEFWSLDMRERVVREKFGSGLVVSSMFLLLLNQPSQLRKYGLGILVGTAYGISFFFFAFQHHQIRFD